MGNAGVGHGPGAPPLPDTNNSITHPKGPEYQFTVGEGPLFPLLLLLLSSLTVHLNRHLRSPRIHPACNPSSTPLRASPTNRKPPHCFIPKRNHRYQTLSRHHKTALLVDSTNTSRRHPSPSPLSPCFRRRRQQRQRIRYRRRITNQHIKRDRRCYEFGGRVFKGRRRKDEQFYQPGGTVFGRVTARDG